MKRISIFIILLSLSSCLLALKVEIAIDHSINDGVFTTIVAPSENEAVLNTILDLQSLSNGFHTIFVQATSANGQKSIPCHYSIFKVNDNEPIVNVANLEYFIDTDPGMGNGTSIAVPGLPYWEHLLVLGTTDIPYGFHTLGLRAKSTSNRWSQPVFYRLLCLGNPNMDNIQSITWYFTNANSNTPVSQLHTLATSVVSLDASLVIPLTELSQGQTYNMHVYATSIYGVRSQELILPITVNWIPQNVQPTQLSNNIILTWEPILGADYYTIYGATDPTDGFEILGTTDTTTWSEQMGNKKFYRVGAATNQD